MAVVEPLVRVLAGMQNFRGRDRALQLLSGLTDGVVLRSKYGPLMRARFNDFTCMAGIRGEYGETVLNAVRALGPGDCFIDVGANAGVWSLLAGQKVGPDGIVVAFEPQSDLADDLRRNVRLNRLTNILVLDFAVGHQTRLARVTNVRASHTGVAHLTDNDADGPKAWVINPAEDLPFLLRAARNRRVMIKIDTEGSELAVLMGLREVIDNTDARTVVVEINPVHLERFAATPDDIYAFLGARGFKPTIGMPRGTSEVSIHYDEVFQR